MEESVSSKEPNKISVSNFNTLSSDLTEYILSILPITSIVRATAVCKLWHSIVTASTFFSAAKKKPFFFLYGQHKSFSGNNRFFAFDPDSNHWLKLPVSEEAVNSSFSGCNRFYFSIISTSRFFPILSGIMHNTCMLKFPRQNPLVGVFYKCCNLPSFIVVGGVNFIGGLMDREDRLAVDPHIDSWQICPHLPDDFGNGESSKSLSSALLNGKLYVFGIYSGFGSTYDLNKNVWSGVQTLRPPGVSDFV